MSAGDVKFELSVLHDTFVVSRLAASAPVPSWAFDAAGFVSVTRTDDELSIICSERHAAIDTASPVGWRALKVHGHALAAASVSLLAIATHDTDYLFVRSAELAHAVRALRHGGHIVHVRHE